MVKDVVRMVRRGLRALAPACVLAGMLCACKPGVNQKRDVHGLMALHYAVQHGDLEKVQKLFEAGASPNVQDLDGVTPLHRAARDGNIAMAKLLIEHHANLSLQTKEGWDALHLAVWKDHAAMVQLLLSYGAVVNRKTPQGWTAVHMTAMKDSRQILELILQDWPGKVTAGKPSLDEKDVNGNAPLHLALRNHAPTVAEYLLAKGADPNATDAEGNTPLHLLAGTGADFLAMQMFYCGADINRINLSGKSPYAAAFEKQDAAVCRVLAERGAR